MTAGPGIQALVLLYGFTEGEGGGGLGREGSSRGTCFYKTYLNNDGVSVTLRRIFFIKVFGPSFLLRYLLDKSMLQHIN